MIVLVPVRQPLTDDNRAALQRGRSLIEGHDDAELLVLAVNLVHRDDDADRAAVRESVEAALGEVAASYAVRAGISFEEAIVDEAVRQDVDHVVLTERRRGALEQALARVLGGEVDLAARLGEQLGAEIHVV